MKQFLCLQFDFSPAGQTQFVLVDGGMSLSGGVLTSYITISVSLLCSPTVCCRVHLKDMSSSSGVFKGLICDLYVQQVSQCVTAA